MRRRRGTTPRQDLRRRPHLDEATIEARISAGEDWSAFLCLECDCWLLDPAYCLCRERAPW
jgi:hypothetical protein